MIPVTGVIRTSMNDRAFGPPDAEDLAEQLHKVSDDPDIKAIVLRINSPGGSVGSVQEIYSELLRCRKNGKKIVASMGDVAASGGYYLAAAADHIVAEPGTITGSIGVIFEFPTLEGLMQKIGVKLEVIKSGQHKDIGSPARALTPEERQLLQAGIDDAYQQFLDAVVQGRKSTADKIRPLADGRIFTGRQALAAGLIDSLGGRQEAIATAARLAGLPENPRVISSSSKGVQALLKKLGSQWGLTGWQVLEQSVNSPLLEYRWR